MSKRNQQDVLFHGGCFVCRHERRAEIELKLANNTPIRTLAATYGMLKDSLYRHRKNHMAPELISSLALTGKIAGKVDLELLKRTESEGLLATLVHERCRQQRIADKAEAFNDYANATRASVAALKSSELIAKLLGDIKTGGTTNNILLAPEYHAFRTAIIHALRPFIDAKFAVLEALQRLENQPEVINVELINTSS